MTVKVRVEDHGAKRAQALLRQPRKKLRIGVLENEAAQPHPTRPGVTVGDVAIWMEYGTGDGRPPNTPARSFIFDWKDENIDKIAQQLATDTLRVIFSNENEVQALSKRGTMYRDWIRKRIVARPGNWKPLSPRRIREKGHDMPLIDTGLLYESIRWEVV